MIFCAYIKPVNITPKSITSLRLEILYFASEKRTTVSLKLLLHIWEIGFGSCGYTEPVLSSPTIHSSLKSKHWSRFKENSVLLCILSQCLGGLVKEESSEYARCVKSLLKIDDWKYHHSCITFLSCMYNIKQFFFVFEISVFCTRPSFQTGCIKSA